MTVDRPTVLNVAVTTSALASLGASFSVLVYDPAWDGSPGTATARHVEAFHVTAGGGGLVWTATTESGWIATTHAIGSIVVATTLTPRSLTQQMVDHTTPLTTPNPHSMYLPSATYTTKGDLLVGTGNGTYTRQGVGADGTSPVADSTQITGIRWMQQGLTSLLTHMGDLIVGGLLGVAQRLGIGTLGQALVVAYNSAVVADPLVGPACSATSSGGALVNGTAYDFAFAWQTPTAAPDGGNTLPSPRTTFVATATGTVAVLCPAAPDNGLTLLVYAAVLNNPLQLQGTVTNAPTSATTTVNVATISGGATPSTVNSTGGLGPSWANIGSVSSVALSVPAEFNVTGSPVTGGGTITIGKANQLPNTVYAGPSGGAGTPAFRALINLDLPFLGFHDQFLPITSATTVTLNHLPNIVLIVAVNGAVKSTPADYSVSGQVITFVAPFTTGDVVVVSYMGQTPVFGQALLSAAATMTARQPVYGTATPSAAAASTSAVAVGARATLAAVASRTTSP